MHMETLAGTDGGRKDEGFTLLLQTVGKGDQETWTLNLDEDMLSLQNADAQLVLAAPKDEAARYIRFAWKAVSGVK